MIAAKQMRRLPQSRRHVQQVEDLRGAQPVARGGVLAVLAC
jgi:hypothetical protein